MNELKHNLGLDPCKEGHARVYIFTGFTVVKVRGISGKQFLKIGREAYLSQIKAPIVGDNKQNASTEILKEKLLNHLTQS